MFLFNIAYMYIPVYTKLDNKKIKYRTLFKTLLKFCEESLRAGKCEVNYGFCTAKCFIDWSLTR